MTDYEKLVELIGMVQDEGRDYSDCFLDSDKPAPVDNNKLVEYLVANDVTIMAHGVWEPWAGSLLRCSVCAHEYLDYLECTNYCGNCGAKMDGEANDH